MINSELLSSSLSLWGAFISTILGIIRLIEFFRNKIKILVRAQLVFNPINEDEECKGTKVNIERAGLKEILLEVEVINSGRRAIQITSIVIEDNLTTNVTQVLPEKFPVLLDPLTSVKVEIQKEWIDKTDVKFFGVIDALGKKHGIKTDSLKSLLAETNKYPSNKKKYVSKTNSKEIVEAFQVHDKSVITTRNNK